MCAERPGQADCNLGSSSPDGARERGPSLSPSEMGAPHPRWPVLAGGQSHDPSAQQAVSRGFDVLVADAVKPPACCSAALGKAPLHWAHGGPSQQRTDWEQTGRSPALTEPPDHGQRAALCSCPTLGMSCVTEQVLCGTT